MDSIAGLVDIENQIEEISGIMDRPSLCEGTSSTFTRVTGFFRPVENFNAGKQAEYMQRLEYSMDYISEIV